MYGTGTGPHQSWTVQLPDNVTESCEGYLDLNYKKSRRGLTVFRNPVKSNTHNNVLRSLHGIIHFNAGLINLH